MTKDSNVVPLRNKRSVKEWVTTITDAWQKQVGSVIETGKALAEAQLEVEHGEWIAMVEDKLPFSRSTASRLMKIAGNSVLANGAHVHHLPASWGTLSDLTKMPESELRARLKDGTVNSRTQRKDVAEMLGKKKPAKASKLKMETLDGMRTEYLKAIKILTAKEREQEIASLINRLHLNWAAVYRSYVEQKEQAGDVVGTIELGGKS